MKRLGPLRSLLGLLVLATTGCCRLFFNRGLLFPCVFFEPNTGKLLVLYGLQQASDVQKTFVVPGNSTTPSKTYSTKGNFCKVGNSTQYSTQDLQTKGALILSDVSTGDDYALSYSDGYLNSTLWTMEYEGNPESGGAIRIKGTNDWAGSKTKIVSSVVFTIICDTSIGSPDAFQNSLRLVSLSKGSSSEAVFEGRSNHACGIDARFLVEWNSYVVLSICGVFGLFLLFLGYGVLKWSLTLSLFLLGCCLAASEVFDNSTISAWGRMSWVCFIVIILGMGFIMSYSAFYFPTGAIYLFSIYLGYTAASAVSEYYFIKDRFFVGYILIHAVFLAASLAIFRHNLNNCKFGFTAILGGWLVLVMYTNLRYKEKGLYLDGILRPVESFKLYPLSAMAACFLIFGGFFTQRSLFKRQIQQEGPDAEIDEFMQQQ